MCLFSLKKVFAQVRPLRCVAAFLSSAFLAFGMYNVHAVAHVTEGGVLGATLLLEQWFGISPSVSGCVMNLACYALGWRMLGSAFIVYSSFATAGFSLSYALCELWPPLWPQLAQKPLAAAFAGALFVGIGAGACVRAGGATGGDDALAMGISRLAGCKLQTVYLISDITVLALSLSYIPLQRIGYSLLTVLLSGQLIGFMQRPLRPRRLRRAPGK